MTHNITLSPYKITWVEFRAVKGIVTKADNNVILPFNRMDLGKNGDRIHMWFGSKESAQEYLRTHDFSKLSKHYEVRLCTDKQLSMGKRDYDNHRLIIKFTEKQEKEMFPI